MIDFPGRHPMWVTDGIVGRDEKNLIATSGLGLIHDVSLASSEWDRRLSNTLSFIDDLDLHINHAEDPAANSISLADGATFNMDFARPGINTLDFTDYAHAALDGYHPGTGNGGDPDLSLYTMTSAAAIVEGSPVYISSSNTVNSANASPTPDAAVCTPVGFATNAAASAGADVNVLTEGHVELSDWAAVAGTTNLVAGAKYKLGTIAGTITTTAPTGNGEHVVRVGIAITTKILDIEISNAVVR